MRGKKSIVCLSFLLVAVLFLQGCLYDITSIVVPDSTTTGMVITFDVNAVGGSEGSTGGGIVLQIPEGTNVLRVHYSAASGSQGFLTEDSNITIGYQPEPGYHLYGGYARAGGSSSTSIELKVWLAVPAGVTPGTYNVKASIGDYSGSWTPQSPKVGGVVIMDFNQITGNYASNDIVISAGTADTFPPADVTPVITGNYSFDISDYDEAAEGDVAAYRVYVSKDSFTATTGRQLLDEWSTPAVGGNSLNNIHFSGDIGGGLYFFDIPPGSEYPLTVGGLFANNYYFAVTAVDISGNESSPVVVPMLTGSVTGTVTGGSAGIPNVWVNVVDVNCYYRGWAYTDADGNFSVAGLRTGDYKVYVSASNGYLEQWYNGESDCSTADTVSVTAPDDTTVNVVLARGGSISGTVTDGANGIADVWVYVYDENCSSLRIDNTDAAGNYSIAGLQTGYYKVHFQAVASSGYLSEWNSEKTDCSTADIILLTAPDVMTVNAVLAQGGQISGTVSDGSDGIANITVKIYDANCSWKRDAYTDANGNYSAVGLQTGDYKVKFQASPFSGYLSEWNSDKTECGAADTVSVTAPDVTTVNAVLAEGGRISGTVTDGTSGIANVWVSIYDANCLYQGGVSTDASGHYSWIGLQTGNYKVYFQESFGSQWYSNKTDCETADTVEVTAPQEMTVDVTLSRFRTLAVTGAGTGMGSISSNPTGINLEKTCTGCEMTNYHTFPAESDINLTASASPGSVFVNWTGACLGNTNPCKVTMNGDKSVTAAFDSIADFTAMPTSGDAPFFVSFVDESNDSPTSWAWSFGDGGTSTVQNPIHNYASPGFYTVSLQITTGSGSYGMTKNSYISVWSCQSQPARSGIYSYIPYSTIQAAYNTATDGEIVEAQAKTFSENLNFMNNTSIIFRGGFDCYYQTNEGQYATVHGKVTISDGTVTVENLVIK